MLSMAIMISSFSLEHANFVALLTVIPRLLIQVTPLTACSFPWAFASRRNPDLGSQAAMIWKGCVGCVKLSGTRLLDTKGGRLEAGGSEARAC
jgi:hypothetical protein